MGYVYMRRRAGRNFRTEAEIASVKEIVLTSAEGDSIFRIMQRVYRLLDDWRMFHADTSVLLTVDLKIAKVVNSYFYEMTESEYERFFLRDGEVLCYHF